MNKRTTIADIAKKSGYSKTAVSFAFNCPERISQKAREKILSVAEELDFIPDPMARNFSLGKHMTIGFLLPQKIEESLSNPYTQEVIKGIGKICESHGYTLTIIPPLNSSIEEAIKHAAVDGLIAMGFFFDKGINESFRRRNLPVVIIDGNNDEKTITIGIDDIKAAELEMSCVLEKGHRKIAILSLPDDPYLASNIAEATTIAKKRKFGYYNALATYGLNAEDVILSSCGATLEDGRKAAGEILDTSDTTCFVCMSDIVALGAIHEITKRGMFVPDDISVVGFDGILDPMMVNYDITTIVQSADKKGMKAASILFDILDGKDVDKVNNIEYFLKHGNTLAPPRR